jgi:uncharacterized protein (DUF342 family)
MGYTKQYWLEELRDERGELEDDLRKAIDLRELYKVKASTATQLSVGLVDEYTAKLVKYIDEMNTLEQRLKDVNKLIDYLQSLDRAELKRSI